MLKINKTLGDIPYSDNPKLESDIDNLYNTILVKYGYQAYIERELAKKQLDPTHFLGGVHDIEHELYHHVRAEFLHNYGGVPRKTCNTGELLAMIRNRKQEHTAEFTDLFNARVELYTGIVVLFQEYGGIPKVTNKY